MSAITIYPEEPCIIPVKYKSNPLLVYGKDYADIENIKMCLKETINDADDAYLEKLYKIADVETGDVLLNTTEHTFSLVKLETDVLPVNKKLKLYIGVKVSGLTKYLWLRVDKDGVIHVEPDGIDV